MRDLVFPDVHQRWRQVVWALQNETYDRAYFLGDYFDSKEDDGNEEVSSFEDSCTLLRYLILESKRKDDFRFCLGNHDMGYFYANNAASQHSSCKSNPYATNSSSHKKEKKFRKAFYDVGLRDSFFVENFNVAIRAQGHILSHAGIVIDHLPMGMGLQFLIYSTLPIALKNFRFSDERSHLLRACGKARGGRDEIGGPLWLDWHSEFYCDGMTGNQIVGHTTVDYPEIKHCGDNRCFNLNSERHYGILENGQFSIRLFYDEHGLNQPGDIHQEDLSKVLG